MIAALRFVAVALVAVLLTWPVAHFVGRRAGEREAQITALETSIKALKSRGKTDAEISAADAGALCAHYGLPDKERADCMRRVADAAAIAGNGRGDHDKRPAIRKSGGGP